MCDKACAASQKEFELINLQREAQREKLEFLGRISGLPEGQYETWGEGKPARFEIGSHFQQQERLNRALKRVGIYQQIIIRANIVSGSNRGTLQRLDTLKLSSNQGINNSLSPTDYTKTCEGFRQDGGTQPLSREGTTSCAT